MSFLTNGGFEKVYLRQTLFQPGEEPLTTVIQKEDLKADIHAVATNTRSLYGNLVDVEIFTWAGDLTSATVEAHRRAKAGRISRNRRHKDTLHDFLITTFAITTPTGVIAPKSPAPLSTADVREVLEAVRHHPRYEQKTILVISEEGEAIRLSSGVISVQKLQ